MAQKTIFQCIIGKGAEQFSAKVEVVKKKVVRTSLQDNKIDLADIYITPLSANPNQVHNHFVLHSYDGSGFYVVRNRFNRSEAAEACSIWDLGPKFALKVREAINYFR